MGEALVQEAFLHAATDVFFEVLNVELLELFGGRVVAQHLFVDGLHQKASSDHVEGRVIFDVLQGNLDYCFIELLGGDAIKKGQFQLAGDLRNPRDGVFETLCCVLDRQVDFVGVVWLPLAVALHHRDVHAVSPLRCPLGTTFCRYFCCFSVSLGAQRAPMLATA